MSPTPHVAILGAGPAGLGAAYRLRVEDRARVTVIERELRPGGNAGSFELNGLRVDYGSHRLHPSTSPAILADIRRLLGDDLLDRPRHGRIGLRGRWIHFPLKPVDLLLRLDPGFALGSLRDVVAKPFRPAPARDTFADVLRASLGPTICEQFYFPYARKIWGRPPEELSGIQARRRVSAGSFGKLLGRVLGQVPGFKRPGAGRFFYPRRGFGQISEAYAEAAEAAGAELRLGHRVVELRAPGRAGEPWTVVTEHAGGRAEVEADYVWSTLPVTVLARLVRPEPAPPIREAGGALSYRGMVLVYLELPVDRFTEYDAHYFPSAAVRITRLSEPKNYAARRDPEGRTILCAELPSSPDDPWWRATDPELGELVGEDLARAGVPLPARPIAVTARRLPQAYPIYTIGYEGALGALDRWVDGLDGVLSYGRQGLFAHDNTHHALAMAYAAVDCLRDGRFDRARWAEYRTEFETHVVED